MLTKVSNQRAFTLIELIVVIAILALIAAAVFVLIDPGRRIGEAKDAQRYSDLTAITKAINFYTADNGELPEDILVGDLKLGDKIVLCSQAQDLSCDGQVHPCMVIDDEDLLGKYLNLPVDPDKTNTQDTGYYITRNPANYITFGACSSYDQSTDLRIVASARVDSFRAIYRSVGPSNTSALATGTSNALTIANNEAVFASALVDNIGVGDVIQYDSDNDGNIDALAFIQGRYSSTRYSVVDVDGNAPTATTVADNDWDIFRAYTSLYNAERGVENTGIIAPLRNFDTWTDPNLVSLDKQWNLALYADSADTQNLTISNWTTSEDNYLRIYAPNSPSEVGASQRHSGTWDSSKARLVTTNNSHSISIWDDYVKIDGLQIHQNVASTARADAISVMFIGSPAVIEISNNIIRGSSVVNTNGISDERGFREDNTVIKTWNTIVYDFPRAFYWGNTAPSYTYNTTIHNASSRGFDSYWSVSNAIAKNVLTQSCADGFYGTPHAYSDYNLSDIASDAPGTNSKNSTNVSFVNEAGDNFHLVEGDTGARDSGIDLSNDDDLNFFNDVDGGARADTWDIGADEY